MIKLKVKNSQLDTQTEMLITEEAQLEEQNKKLAEENEKMVNEKEDTKHKIDMLIKNIKISNLLKDIDLEEMQLMARNNASMKRAFEDMITKWEAIN